MDVLLRVLRKFGPFQCFPPAVENGVPVLITGDWQEGLRHTHQVTVGARWVLLGEEGAVH